MVDLVKRKIDLRFELGEGSFGADGSDTFTVTGVRVSCSIEKTGGASMSQCSLKTYGLPLDVMNKLTLLGKPLIDGRHNRVTVLAGDDVAGMAVVFVGTIAEAWVDAKGMPAVALVVTAFTDLIVALEPVPPVSYRGSVDVALVASAIAAQARLGFENSGVSGVIEDPYLTGTAQTQLLKLARAGNFNCIVDQTPADGLAVCIWPAGGQRGGQRPLVSADTGMVGYPMRTENGVEVTTLFNPSITFGATIEIKSTLTPANGVWQPFRVAHDLESETPGGKWFTTAECSILGQAFPVVE